MCYGDAAASNPINVFDCEPFKPLSSLFDIDLQVSLLDYDSADAFDEAEPVKSQDTYDYDLQPLYPDDFQSDHTVKVVDKVELVKSQETSFDRDLHSLWSLNNDFLENYSVDIFDEVEPIKSNHLLGRHLQIPLGRDFVPGPYDVICRRGKTSFDHAGNRKFRILIALHLEDYVESSRTAKTAIVNSLVDQVRESSPMGGFVRRDKATGEWFEIGTQAARDRVGHAVRDCISVANKRCREEFQNNVDRRLSLRLAQNELLRSSMEDLAPSKKRRKTWPL